MWIRNQKANRNRQRWFPEIKQYINREENTIKTTENENRTAIQYINSYMKIKASQIKKRHEATEICFYRSMQRMP